MSLSINFDAHSHYKGFAIQYKPHVAYNDITDYRWSAYTDNGNTYQVDELHAMTLEKLKHKINEYRGDLI